MIRQFERLAVRWHFLTGMHSSTTIRRADQNYQDIVAMGWQVVPLLLKFLTVFPDWWFFALREITGESPFSPEHRGYYDAMKDDWLEWAKAKGIPTDMQEDFIEELTFEKFHALWNVLDTKIRALIEKVKPEGTLKYFTLSEVDDIQGFLLANEFGLATELLAFIVEHTRGKDDPLMAEINEVFDLMGGRDSV